jgi:hypothetical protein
MFNHALSDNLTSDRRLFIKCLEESLPQKEVKLNPVGCNDSVSGNEMNISCMSPIPIWERTPNPDGIHFSSPKDRQKAAARIFFG